MFFFHPRLDGWHPRSELNGLREEVRRLLRTPRGRAGAQPRERTTKPPANIWSNEDDALVALEVPGPGASDSDIDVHGDNLTCRSTRESHEFERSFQFPFEIDASKVEAHCSNGALEVKVPRARTVHRITVRPVQEKE